MKYAEIRQAFISFFESHQHKALPSSSLIPHEDPSLMFTNAGMNQFKDVFLGTDQRDYKRAVTVQKCLRAGGKHNDLENVGFTARHHTFFEMLGNFSFGDYFKEEAIQMAWTFLTESLKIPKNRLYVSVFETDDEAFEIWEKQIGIPQERIFRFGEKDNFWRMGQTGPCGPCSEIFFDHKPEEPVVPIDQDEDRFVEIWNLVFMQFFEDETGTQTPLPKPSVDTGSGLERVAAALQGVSDNYQSDIFQPIIEQVCADAGLPKQWDSLAKEAKVLGAVKVVADHARAACFLLSEGVLPSNEGRGYVLRRIMRRAIRYARSLSEQKSLYSPACEQVIQTMSPFYPLLSEKADFILKAVQDEEARFLQTLDKGNEILQEKMKGLKKQKQTRIDGETAFTLYDTYGFPFDLTQVVAKEQGFDIDEEGFLKAMDAAKNRARAAQKTHSVSSHEKYLGEWTQNLEATEFVGYEQLQLESQLLSVSNGETTLSNLEEEGYLAFFSTPFYAEGGGQVADQGVLLSSQGDLLAQIVDCKKINDVFVHRISQPSQALKVGQNYQLKVATQRRQSTANNHSATHLMHAALKKVLGDHVSQAGSLVNEWKLRFDFNHSQPVNSDELAKIEQLVNEQVAQAMTVQSEIMGQEEAISQGATAMFGEKYGDQVRVIRMGSGTGSPFSMELCGGTHVRNTSEIRLFKIVNESGVAAGVRRIEALTGDRAFQYLSEMAQENLNLCEQLKVKKPKVDDTHFGGGLSSRLLDLQAKIKKLESDLKKKASQSVSIDDVLKEAVEKNFQSEKGLALISRVAIEDRNLLSQIADRIRDKKPNVALALVGESPEGKPRPLIVAISKNLKNLHAGKITRELCNILDGKGGGRPDFAQGSISNLDQWQTAKEKFYELLD